MTTENKPSEFKVAITKLCDDFKYTAYEFLEERLGGSNEDSLRAYQLNEFVRQTKTELACDFKRLLNKNLKDYVRDTKFWEGK